MFSLWRTQTGQTDSVGLINNVDGDVITITTQAVDRGDCNNMLRIYDSLSREKKVFKPLRPGEVSLYLCGVTVYDYCHIGHARTVVFFDSVCRFLEYIGYSVRYIRNITDIDDKILLRAHEAGVAWQDLTERFINAMHADYSALGVRPPDEEPRATAVIDEMICLIAQLIEKRHAYVVRSGDVYFDTAAYPDYGKLMHQPLEDLRRGARVDVNTEKKDPLDFVLWKTAKQGEPAWNTPWGAAGRPGWHIECTTMATKEIGYEIDLHGGGYDLRFPHHENERAQAEACSGKHYVNHWMHVGFVQVDNEKMSKSLDNFFLIRDVLAQHHPETVRIFLLSRHYRSPVHYSRQSLEHAENNVRSLYLALRGLPSFDVSLPQSESHVAAFHEAMCDDFNIPQALAVLFALAKAINIARSTDSEQTAILANTLKTLAGILGLCQSPPEDFLRHGSSAVDEQAIEALIAARAKARIDKDFAKADAIREELHAMGVVTEDSSAGTTWRKQ